MAIDSMPNSAFNEIPTDLRLAGFFAEVDGSAAAQPTSTARALLIGQKLAAGTAPAGVPVLVARQGSEAPALFGRGSMLAAMVAVFRANNETLPLYAIPLDDLEAGAAAATTITVTGPATVAGTIALWIAGASKTAIGDYRVSVGVSAGDTASTIAAAVATAINTAADLPVTAAAVEAVVTVTARNKGLVANEIRVQHSLAGSVGGESLPAGVALTIPGEGYLTGGTGNPDLTAAIAAMGDVAYDYIAMPYTDAASLNALDVEMVRRWGPMNQIYGLYFTAKSGSLSALTTFGLTRNGKFGCVVGGYDRAAPGYLTAARAAARAGAALFNHPARALVGLTLTGERAEPEASSLTKGDKNQLLWSGISVLDRQSDGTVTTNRLISMYRVNAAGDADEAFLDLTTAASVQYVARELRSVINSRYLLRRCVLVEDGDEVASGIPVCSPRLAKGTLIEHYKSLVRNAITENVEEFAKRLVVTKVGTRLNILYRPDLGNPLYTVAVQIQFSLDFGDF